VPYADLEARRAYYREWKKGEGKRLSNKYFDAAKHANARAEKYGVPGRLTTADVRSVLEGKPCVYCGTDERVGLDHAVAMAYGGPNAVENIVPACQSCNARKRRSATMQYWADGYTECISCHLTDQRHAARGLCQRCYNREANKRRGPRTKSGKSRS
jgi:hypothetical protein